MEQVAVVTKNLMEILFLCLQVRVLFPFIDVHVVTAAHVTWSWFQMDGQFTYHNFERVVKSPFLIGEGFFTHCNWLWIINLPAEHLVSQPPNLRNSDRPVQSQVLEKYCLELSLHGTVLLKKFDSLFRRLQEPNHMLWSWKQLGENLLTKVTEYVS